MSNLGGSLHYINSEQQIDKEIPYAFYCYAASCIRPMFDFRADEARKEAHDLIDSLTDYDVSRGLRLSFTCYPSFTQIKGADSVEVEINVGTSSKPCKRSVTKYIYKGCINTHTGADDEERTQLFCPHCGKALVRNGTITTTLKDIPSGASYADMEILRHRWLCKDKNCHYCWTEPIEFKDQDHLLTSNLVRFICGLLQQGLSMYRISLCFLSISAYIIKLFEHYFQCL